MAEPRVKVSVEDNSSPQIHDDDQPIFAPPTSRKTIKVTKGSGPSNPVDVSFKDLSVRVKDSRSKAHKTIVDKVSGFAGKGEVVYILGPSGCGKTTILKSIANAASQSNYEVEGDVYFNSRRLRSADRRQILSYVPQEAPLLGEFTVDETLWFAARLYFGYTQVSRDEIQLKIDDIVEALGLESCRSVIVGNLFFRGLSGGQKKRLSIAVELISSPAVLVLDEPTSGLDSASAMTVVQALRNLGRLSHTIIATIHQPSSKMWSEFGNVMLMSQGRSVYFGKAEQAVEYFSALGMKCPSYYNPADYFSAVLSTDFATSEFQTRSAKELADLFDSSSMKRVELGMRLDVVEEGRKTMAQKNQKKNRVSGRYAGSPTAGNGLAVAPSNAKFDALIDEDSSKRALFGASNNSLKQAGFISGTVTLVHRFLMSLYREPGLVLARIFAYISVGITLGLVYLRIGESYDTEALLARPSVLLATVGFFSFFSVSAIPFIMENRAVMDRERHNGAYRISSYVLADALVLIPSTAVLSVFASVILVYVIALNNFGEFYLTFFVFLYCIEMFVHAIASFFFTMETAVAFGVGMFGIVFLCAGFFIPVEQMSWAIRWVAYIAPPRYAFRAFMRNEFLGMNSTQSSEFPDGEAMLNFFQLNDDAIATIGEDQAVIAAMAISYLMIVYVTIRFYRS